MSALINENICKLDINIFNGIFFNIKLLCIYVKAFTITNSKISIPFALLRTYIFFPYNILFYHQSVSQASHTCMFCSFVCFCLFGWLQLGFFYRGVGETYNYIFSSPNLEQFDYITIAWLEFIRWKRIEKEIYTNNSQNINFLCDWLSKNTVNYITITRYI